MRPIKFRRALFLNDAFYYFKYWGKDIDAAKFITPGQASGYDTMDDQQFTGLLDKNGKEIYEGDVLRWYRLEIEWQTHHGDNIPMGEYTEPCGTIASKIELPVLFRDAKFTCQPAPDPEEEAPSDYDCPFHFPQYYDRKELDHIFWPRPGGRENERMSDEDFLESAQGIATELGFEVSTIEEFIECINAVEVIGNIYQNPELLNPPA